GDSGRRRREDHDCRTGLGIHPGEGWLIAQPQAAPLAQSLHLLQQKIGIHFRDPGLLLEAVTHSSFANESPSVSPRDNERLEYLGDAVLQLITAEYLYKHHPGATEGELTQTRSAMVNTNTLAQLAEQLDLGSYLYLGKGIAKGGGRNLKSLLANGFEAVLGAVFLEAGQDAARAALESLLGSVKEMPAAKPARQSRARRAPRKKRESPQAAAPVQAEVVPMPELRSRQFGEPID